MRPTATSHVLSIATALPDHVCTMEQSIQIARRVFADEPDALAFAERLIRASGIEKRHTVLADHEGGSAQPCRFTQAADLRSEPSTAKRNEIFGKEAAALALKSCQSLQSADWRHRLTHLITASCTGFTAPGFDVALMKGLGLSPRVQRVHVGFMGCYAGFTTLKLADAICRAQPSALVLIVHVELCTLHVHFRTDPHTLIADSLFADGAAAALVGCREHARQASQEPALAILGSTSLLLPEGERDMTWTVGDQGFDMRLSPRVPHLLRKYLPDALAAMLDSVDVEPGKIRHWAIHPGGPAILDQAKVALGIDEAAVATSRQVLAQYGNMSSATLWFLLDLIRRRAQPGLIYACGFGPGLTLESAVLSHHGER